MKRKFWLISFVVIFFLAVCTLARALASLPEKKVNLSSFSARVAFIKNDSLYVFDGMRKGSKPIKIDTEGEVEIVGWSPDGEWLMYLERYPQEEGNNHNYIQVVKADGTNRQQIDSKPVRIRPEWAPEKDVIAYSNCLEGERCAPIGNLKVATFEKDSVEITTLLPEKSGLINSIAWAPDGQSIAFCKKLSENNLILIERIDLEGKCWSLLTVEKTGLPFKEGNIFSISGATGLKWSPDGRYLAYYLLPGSGSMAADGTSIRVSDLQQDDIAIKLGIGLAYKEWLAWSPDSRYLAYIKGNDRSAINNKELWIADMNDNVRTSTCAMEGQVDTRPIWLPTTEGEILFCRGNEVEHWSMTLPEKLLLPGQRIWQCKLGEEPYPITTGDQNTSDYITSISPDGKNLLFFRLEHYEWGSLYYKNLDENKQVELIKGISGEPGFYGNYYPETISVYWEK